MLEDILAKLDAKTRSRVIAASNSKTERIALPSMGLNLALGGGIGRGRQTLVYGSKSASKSSLTLQTIALQQSLGKTCALIDAENSFDPTWATALGVKNEELILSQERSIDGATSIGCDLLRNGVDFLAIDSVSALLPSSYFEDNSEVKDGLEGTKQIGQFSKEMTIAVNKFNYANDNTALLIISQTRNKINTYGASLQPMGGQGMLFFSSTVIKLWATASDKEQYKAKVKRGNKEIEQPVGRPVTWTVEYNKIGPPGQIGKYDFYYKGDELGIDYVAEVVDLSTESGIIEKKGAWFAYDGQSFQGRAKLIQYFKENELEFKGLEKELGSQ